MFKKILSAGVPVLVGAASAVAFSMLPASATPTTATAVTHVTDRGDSGYGGNNWAVDDLTRTVTVTLVGPDSANPALYDYTGTITDTGTAAAIDGQVSPGAQATAITNNPVAQVSGSGTYTFSASSDTPDGALVPTSITGDSPSTTSWIEQFFPSTTTFANENLPTWSWSYSDTRDCQSWTDAYNGIQSTSGDITGADSCALAITPPGDQTVQKTKHASIQVFASTASSDKALTFSATGLPAGLSIGASTGRISGVPTGGSSNVTVTVTDFGGKTQSTEFRITVKAAPVAPPAPPKPPVPPAPPVHPAPHPYIYGGHIVSISNNDVVLGWHFGGGAKYACTQTFGYKMSVNGSPHLGFTGGTEGFWSGLAAGHTYDMKIYPCNAAHQQTGPVGWINLVTTR